MKSRYIDRIIVSTDNERIAQIASTLGVEVIKRPPEFSTDDAPTELALVHVLETLKQHECYQPDIVVTLEPTSPLRTHRLIDHCVETLMSTDADAVLSVVETRDCFGTLIDGRFEYLIKNQPRRRQDREPLFKESSAVYVTKAESLLRCKSVLGEKPRAVVAAQEEALDINRPLDFAIAEAVINWRQEGGLGND